jgi:hypothetical protein
MAAMSNLSSDTVGLMRREFRDVHSVVSRMDHQLRRLTGDGRATINRAGGLVVRAGLCSLLGHLRGQDADQIARELFPVDRDLDRLMQFRAVASPTNTTVTGWAAELVQTVVGDIGDRLIPESIFVRLAQQGLSYPIVGNSIVKGWPHPG